MFLHFSCSVFGNVLDLFDQHLKEQISFVVKRLTFIFMALHSERDDVLQEGSDVTNIPGKIIKWR